MPPRKSKVNRKAGDKRRPGMFRPTHDWTATPLSVWQHRLEFLRAASMMEPQLRKELEDIADEYLWLLLERQHRVRSRPRPCLISASAVRRCAAGRFNCWQPLSVDLLDSLGRFNLLDDWCIDAAVEAVRIMMSASVPRKLKHRDMWKLPVCAPSVIEPGFPMVGWAIIEVDLLPFDPRVSSIEDWRSTAKIAADIAIDEYIAEKLQAVDTEFLQPTTRDLLERVHYERTALHQVCGIPKSEIAESSGVSLQAVQNSIRDVERIIGLTPRPRSKGGRPPKP